jgi:hypothetical protein
MVHHRPDQRHRSRVPVSTLEHLWQQLGRQAVQSLHRQWGHMDESNLSSELACLGNAGCGFKRQSFRRRRGQLFQPVLVPPLHQCAEPGRHAYFDQVTQVSLGGSLDFGDTINPGGLAGQVFLAVIVPAVPLTIMFTCRQCTTNRLHYRHRCDVRAQH